MQFLPTEICDQINQKNNLETYSNTGLKGCFLEVDLDYPDKMHDLLNANYPFTLKEFKKRQKMFSEYQLHIIEKNESFSW